MSWNAQIMTQRTLASLLLAVMSVSLARGQTFTIKAKATKGGQISPAGRVLVPAGGSQTFTMTPDTGYLITQVTANKVAQGPVTSYTFIDVQKNGAIKATFKIRTFPVTFSAADGVKISPSGTKTLKYGAKAKIKVTPPAGSSSAPVLLVDGTPVTLLGGPKKYSYILNVTGAHVVQASLTPQHGLTVAKNGTGTGSVTSVPAGIACGSTCTSSFNAGTQVTLTANPSGNSTFAGWSGGGCSGTGTCQVTMNVDTAVTATFTLNAAVQHTLTVGKSGTGSGLVTSNPAGIECGATCSSLYDEGTVITLTATPSLLAQLAPEGSAGSTFAGWSGGGCSGTGTCQVTLNADTTVTATFTLSAAVQHTLTVGKSGTGDGGVTSSPAGINCGATCSHLYDEGTVITLTATPSLVSQSAPGGSAGSTFTGWSGGGCSGTGTCQVTLNADTTVTASFTLTTAKQHSLTVTKNGTGAGSVSSSPAGIACGSTCTSLFDEGTPVTLTGAASGGSTFAGWSGGGCSGKGTCQVTMNADHAVTATFNTSGGGGALAAHVTDSCGAPAEGAILAVHNANGTVQQKIVVGASGIVDLSTFGSPVTFTVGWPNSKGVENAEIHSFVGVPSNLGTMTIALEGGTCPPVDPILGTVMVDLVPAPALTGSVYPLPGAWSQVDHSFDVPESSLQNDGKLTLLAFDGFPIPPATVTYGFLLDQTFTNGANYIVNLDKTPTDLPFTAADDIRSVSIVGTRREQGFSLGNVFLPVAATSGTVPFFDQFPAGSYVVNASASFLLDTFGFPYSSSNWTRVVATAPAALTIPALFNITDFTYDGTANQVTWTLSSNTAGRLGIVGFSNVVGVDDRHWSIVLDPTSGAHTSWAESNLVLPSELDLTGRETLGPGMIGYEFSYIHSYSDALKSLYAGGVTPPAPPYDSVLTIRTVPSAPPLRH